MESAAVVEHSLIPKNLLLGPDLKKEGKLKNKGLRLNLIDKRTLVPAYDLLSRPSKSSNFLSVKLNHPVL